MCEIDYMCRKNEHNTQSPTKKRHNPSIADVIIGTGFGAGFWPWGPGTAGAALATVIWCLYAYQISDYSIVITITLLLAIVGTLISIRPIDRLEIYWGEDPNKVVVDEMVGVWITLLAVPSTKEWYYVISAFLLFRFMDIVKPLGCRAIDKKIHGGWGVMLDDVLAGIYGGIVLFAVEYLLTSLPFCQH